VGLAFAFAARSAAGPRPDNQDSGVAGPGLLAVADGVGGQVGGALASSLVAAWFAPLALGCRTADPEAEVTRVVAGSNERLRAAAEVRTRLRGMATTLDAVVAAGDTLVLAHIGDSRTYLASGGALRQLTRDHTLVQALLDAGSITPAEALVHPHRSAVYAALHGGADDLEGLEVTRVEARPGDRLLVCSDGLSGALAPAAIARLLGEAPDVDQAVTALLGAALPVAGDNVTVAVGEVRRVESVPAWPHRTVGAAAHGASETAEALEALWPGALVADRAVTTRPD
jgi:protein phosphatase